MGNTPERWTFEAAIAQSGLPSPARLILHTLLTHPENETPTAPLRCAASALTLARETGLSRSTVYTHLQRLKGEGWVKR